MPITVEDFHQAWTNQVLRAQAAEANLEQAKKRIADLEAENLKLKAAVENCLRQTDERAKSENVPAEA